MYVHTHQSYKEEKNEYCAYYTQKLEDNEILFKPKILNYDVNIFLVYGKEYILSIKEKLGSKKQYYKFVCFYWGWCWLFCFYFEEEVENWIKETD